MYKKRMMLQRYNKYKIKAILHFSIIIVYLQRNLFTIQHIQIKWKTKQISIIFLKSIILNFIIMHFI